MVTVDLKPSFARFVYPFVFEAGTFAARAGAVKDAVWPGDTRSLQVWQPADFPAEVVLIHVADYLKPRGEAGTGAAPTAQVWEVVNPDTLQSYQGLGAHAAWSLVWPRGEIAFRLDGVQLALFGLGVGFLTVRAQPTSAALDDWLAFLHQFRFARGRHGVRVRARRRTGRDQFAAYFPPSAGGVARLDGEDGLFADVLAGLLRTARLPAETDAWWREVFIPGRLLPFAGLFVDGIEEREIPPLLYRVRNFYGPDQGALVATADLRPDGNPALLPYAERQWFLFSLEGDAFVAFDPPEKGFFREQLPDHLVRDYYMIFLLALLQRFALIQLSAEVAFHWPQAQDPEGETARRLAESAFARINAALLAFTARGYFAQVILNEHHHCCYQRWLEIFQIERLYREVSDEIRAMDGQLRLWRSDDIETQTRRLEGRLNQLALLLGGPALALAFCVAVGPVSIATGVLAVVIGFVAGVALLAVVNLWKHDWRHPRRRPEA